MDFCVLGPHLVAGFALANAVVHNAAAQSEAALESASRAVELFAAMPNPLSHAKALLAVADACQGLGRGDEATGRREEALAIHTRIGAPEAEVVAVLRERP